MKQVIQKTHGSLTVQEVPAPTLHANGVLVRNLFSLVSAGTERTAIQQGSKSLLSRAKARPELAQQVLDLALRDGVIATGRAVLDRLNLPVALGYGSAGIVKEVGAGVTGLQPGDFVACGGGGYATHSELIFVPKNLCVKIPPRRQCSTQEQQASLDYVAFEHAAFTTIGAIAMQGIRQSEAQLGATVAVLGLGLVGMLTVQMLLAAGCRVIGVDPEAWKVELAASSGAHHSVCGGTLERQPELEAVVESASEGQGVDAVIITAATESNDPITVAGQICRDRGRVVIVGAVGLNVPRDLFYEREIELRFSRSYGPGRYDPTYEEKGIDYPIGYVRWTERRNMAAFLDLLAEGKLHLDPLITHRFPIEQAEQAYKLLGGSVQDRYLGILLSYPDATIRRSEDQRRPIQLPGIRKAGTVRLGVIGAGSFARSVLLPHLQRIREVTLKGVATATGPSSEFAGRRFGFEYATCDYRQLLADPEIDALVIATRHNLHAQLVTEALQAGKSVFVEKPLCISESELQQIVAAYDAVRDRGCLVMVGFNRRFAPLIVKAREAFHGRRTPLVIEYRVNAGAISQSHWAQLVDEGGGRIVGEVCHFVDLVSHIVGGYPTRVFTQAATSDNVSISFKYADGSMAAIQYLSIGHPDISKERLEIFGDGSAFIIDDFRRAQWSSRQGSGHTSRWAPQDKGHRAELQAFARALAEGRPSPVPFDEAVRTTIAIFRVLDSLRTGEPIEITS